MPPRTEASAGVGSLVASIKQHKKFRQLASYSVQCLCRAVTPPTVGWEKNLKEAFEAGALEAITDVVTRHKGDEAVLAASTACFGSMATNSKYAEALVDSGAIMGMLESLAANPSGKGEGVKETLQLLETVATTNPEALLKGGGAAATVNLLKAAEDQPTIVAACARTLEKMNKVPGAGTVMMECGAVQVAMTLVGKPAKDEASTEVVEASLRMLDRMCRADETAEVIRTKYNGMQALTTALEANKTNDRICKAGGRVLSKLASGNVAELVTSMNTAKTPAEKEFYSGLLANLALEEENAEKIVRSGGVSALLKSFTTASKKTIESSARAIARLATNEDNVEELVSGGAINTLVTMLTENKDDAAVIASVTPTLAKFATTPERAERLMFSGGVEAVLATLAKHPEFEANSVQALAFIDNLVTMDFDVNVLVDLKAIPAVVAAMKVHPKNGEVQLFGTRCLIYLSGSEANVNAMVAAGVMPVAVTNLASTVKDTVLATVYLVTSLALVPANKEVLVKAGGIDRLLAAIAIYSEEESVKETADEVLSSIIGQEQVAETIGHFAAQLDAAVATKSKADMAKLKEFANRLGALSATPDFAELMIKADGVKQLVAALDTISGKATLPDAEGVLAACGGALTTLGAAISDNPLLSGAFLTSGALKGMVNSVKAAPKLTKHVTTAVKFLEKFAAVPEALDTIVEEGGVEACVAALRANTTQADVALSAMNTMLTIAATDKGSVAVARHGGTRQVIATVAANTGTPNFQAPMEKALTLLQRVALTSEGAEALIKQGGVEAVIQATDVLTRVGKTAPMVTTAAAGTGGGGGSGAGGAAGGAGAAAGGAGSAASAGDEASGAIGAGSAATASAAAAVAAVQAAKAAAASAKVLARLMTSDDVEVAAEDLAELAKPAKTGRLPKLDVLLPVVTRMGYMSTVGGFADIINRGEGAESLAALASIILTKADDAKPDEAAMKSEALPAIFKTVANLSKVTPLDDKLGFAALISKAIEEKHALTECLECIANVAAGSAVSAATLAGDGRTIGMVVDTLRGNMRNNEVATACFNALASLASHDGTAGAVAGSAALSLVSQWLDDNLDDAPRETVDAALKALGNMAKSAPHAQAMLEGGAVELLKAVISKCCIESEVPAPAVLAASVQMLRRLAHNPSGLATIASTGALRRVVRAVTSGDAYMRDEGSMSSIIELIKDSAAVPATHGELAAIHAQELIVAGMNANGTSESVIKGGASALAALGAGEEAARIALDEVSSLTTAIERSSEVTEEAVTRLGEAVQRLGNFMAIPGIVTATTAPAIMSKLSNAVALMAESEMGKPEILAAAVQGIGRLVDMGGKAVEGTAEEAVTMVMDVLALNPDSAAIREAAVHTLGTLATSSTSGLKALHETGGVAVIMDTAKANAGDARLQAIVDSTVTRMTESVTRNATELVRTGGGEALASVVEAASHDATQLSSMLTSIAAVSGGDDALYDVIAAPVNAEVITETLRVLREKNESAASVTVVPGTAKRVQGLTKSLGAALTAQAALTATSDQRTKMQALRMAENTLTLMSHMEMDSGGAHQFFAHNGVDSMMQLLSANAEDPETVGKILGIMRGAMTHATHDGASTMSQPTNMGTVVGLLKMYADSPEIAAGAIEIMAATARVTGAERAGIDREGMRVVSLCQAALSGDVRVKAAIGNLQAVMSTKFAEAESAARAMTSSLAAASHAIAAIGAVQELMTEDGRRYYYDTTSGSTSWEAPPAFSAFKAAMAAAQDAAAKQAEDSVVAVDVGSIANMVSALNTHVRNTDVATSAATTLSALAANDANANMIVQSGGIKAAITAMSVNPDNVALLRVLLVLLERISRNDAFKEQIALAGGLDIIITIAIERHVGIEEVALKSLATLANMAFNSKPNINLIMDKDGVKAVEKCLQKWPKAPRILENAMCVLSNLMFGSEENKLVIGQTCGDEVTHVIRDHPKDGNLFKMALRALGNLAYCDENIRFLVEAHSATKAIVTGMRSNPKDEEALQLAIEVCTVGRGAARTPSSSTPHPPPLPPPPPLARPPGARRCWATLRRWRSRRPSLTRRAT